MVLAVQALSVLVAHYAVLIVAVLVPVQVLVLQCSDTDAVMLTLYYWWHSTQR
jgi:uncharacterized integral membrane protein